MLGYKNNSHNIYGENEKEFSWLSGRKWHYKHQRPSKCDKFTDKQFEISTKYIQKKEKLKHFNCSGHKAGSKQIPNNSGGGKETWETENIHSWIKVYEQLLVLHILEKKELT